MPYDDALANCVRAVLSDVPELSEIRMFGGIAFMAPRQKRALRLRLPSES